MVILWLKEVFRDSKSPPLSQKSWPNCLNTLEIDLSHEWQTVTSTIFILKYFQHVWSFGKMVILWLKVFRDSKSPPLSQKSWPNCLNTSWKSTYLMSGKL
jgi:hypothetical protein